jgi:hypothetical protein
VSRLLEDAWRGGIKNPSCVAFRASRSRKVIGGQLEATLEPIFAIKLEASASSGRSGAMGETTGHATGHISFLGPRFGRFVLGAPDPRSWILVP